MEKKERVVSFDLVRVFSCLCVIIVHFNASISGMEDGIFLHPNSIIPNFYLGGRIYLGGIGTSLFFMLSGATLMMTYREGNLRRFYKKRFLNIYPMFWLAYVLITVIDYLCYRGMSGGSLGLLLFSFIGLDGHLTCLGLIPPDFYKIGEWFLGTILLLYLIFPLLHYCLDRKPLLSFLGALLIYGSYMYCAQVFGWQSNGTEFFMRIPEMMLGMLFVKYDLRRKPKHLLVIAGVFAALTYLLRDILSLLSLSTSFCIPIFVLLVLVGEKIKCSPVKKLLIGFSGLSYPIFLVHHWLIEKILVGFPLSCLSRRDIALLFFIYIASVLLISHLLTVWTDKILASLKALFAPKQAETV